MNVMHFLFCITEGNQNLLTTPVCKKVKQLGT